jgi:hypothetical protein
MLNTHRPFFITESQIICVKTLIERIQQRAVRITFPAKSYNEAISLSNLGKLEERRQAACDKLFKEIIEDPNHKLHPLLPELNSDTGYSLRTMKTFNIPKIKTNRCMNAFLITGSKRFNS